MVSVRQGLSTVVLLLLMAVLCGCAKSPRVEPEVKHADNPPVALLVEQEISGVVLGQKLHGPVGVAASRSGELYVVDAGNSRLLKFSDNLAPLREAGGYGGQTGLFDQPAYLTVDNDLNLYVTDVGNRRICRYNTRMEFVDEIAFSDNDDPFAFGEPSGVAVSAYGELWVADRTDNRIAVFDNVGRFDRYVGGYGYRGKQLYEPSKVIARSRDRFIVCDPGNHRLVEYNQYGDYLRTLAADVVDYPVAVTADRNIIWVLDATAGEVVAMNNEGGIELTIGALLPGTGMALRNPSDLCLLNEGRLVIADTGNNRLLVCRILYENDE